MNKGSNSSLGVYYLFMLFFVIMIIIPPLFRYLMPAQTNTKQNTTNNTNTNNTNNNTNTNNTNNGTNQTTLTKVLNCSMDDTYVTYYIVIKYENLVITDMNFTYILKQENIPADAPLKNIHTVINNLKKVAGASVQDSGNQLNVQFSFSKDSSIPDELKQYTEEVKSQRDSFVKQGFKCNIE